MRDHLLNQKDTFEQALESVEDSLQKTILAIEQNESESTCEQLLAAMTHFDRLREIYRFLINQVSHCKN